MTTTTGLFSRIERAYDAFPRRGGALVEQVGPFDLFVRGAGGWPYYARPRLGATQLTITDIDAVRVRQRELGVPEAFEWVDEVTPVLLPAARQVGLTVLLAPLMVLDPQALPPGSPAGGPTPEPSPGPAVELRLLDPDSPDFADLSAARSAVAELGFGMPGTALGPQGPAQRDAAVAPLAPELLAYLRQRSVEGSLDHIVALADDGGVLATGAVQLATGAAEVVGVATLPSARRHGLGAAVSAALCRHALGLGADLVFLSAESEDVARVYARIGFRRIGTACIVG